MTSVYAKIAGLSLLLILVLVVKTKCSSILGAITEEMPSAEGRGFGFTHHTCVRSRSCLRVYINPNAS